MLDCGDHDLFWDARKSDGRELLTGAYLVRVTTAEGTETARYVAIR